MQSTVNFISDGLGLTPSEYAQVLLECTANGSVRTDSYALGGARLFVEAVHRDRAPAQQAALFDTVFVSLFKCFNSAAGAILAGPEKTSNRHAGVDRNKSATQDLGVGVDDLR